MKKQFRTMFQGLVPLIAVCFVSCGKQTPPLSEGKKTALSNDLKPIQLSAPANLKNETEEARLTNVRAAMKKAASVSILWTSANAEAAKRQLSELVDLHKAVSETPDYENALVSADCELKLCNNIVPSVINGHLSPHEAQSLLASIAANRFSKSSLAAMLKAKAPDSEQAQNLVTALLSGKQVNLVEAIDVLLRQQGASFFDVPAPDRLEEVLDKPNISHALAYHMMGAFKLDTAIVIVAYASAGGDLHADDATVTADLPKRLPQLVNAPGLVTNRPIGVRIVVDYLRDWRNGSYAK